MNVELHIEELVLHGFSQHLRIGDAVEHELSRIITDWGLPPPMARERDISRLDAGAFELTPDLTPDAIGARVAHSLYDRITG